MEKIAFDTISDYPTCPSMMMDCDHAKKIQLASIIVIVALLFFLLPTGQSTAPFPSDRLQQITAKNRQAMVGAVYQFSALTRSWCSGVSVISHALLPLPNDQQWKRITTPTFQAAQHTCHDRDKAMLL